MSIRPILVLGCAFVGCGGGPTSPPGATLRAASEEIPINFVGTVRRIEILGHRRLTALLVDFDARFALTVNVETVDEAGKKFFEAGKDKILAIHSPARLFAAGQESVIDKRYLFSVVWEIDANANHRFSSLAAVSVAVNQRPKAFEEAVEAKGFLDRFLQALEQGDGESAWGMTGSLYGAKFKSKAHFVAGCKGLKATTVCSATSSSPGTWEFSVLEWIRKARGVVYLVRKLGGEWKVTATRPWS